MSRARASTVFSLFTPKDQSQINTTNKDCFNMELNRYNPKTEKYNHLVGITEKFHKAFEQKTYQLELKDYPGGIAYATVTRIDGKAPDIEESKQLEKFFKPFTVLSPEAEASMAAESAFFYEDCKMKIVKNYF